MTDAEIKLLKYYNMLNDEGKAEALHCMEDYTLLRKYTFKLILLEGGKQCQRKAKEKAAGEK